MTFDVKFEIVKEALHDGDSWTLMLIFDEVNPLVGYQGVAEWDHEPNLQTEVNPIIDAVLTGIKAYARCVHHERYKDMLPLRHVDQNVKFRDDSKRGLDRMKVVPYEDVCDK